MRYLLLLFVIAACNTSTKTEEEKQQGDHREAHRPQLHFSPKANWMNDPNGMVFHNGTYHLFFQYYPDSTVWGPMHWGHATSTHLVHWKEEAIALYPDSLGYIFSGSAVVDKNNTSGLGKDGRAPLVAIFTYHDTTGIAAGRINYQTQGLAYSNDDGKTWKKYEHNPVLQNPGIQDFRDPKVRWHEATKKWIMSLAIKDRIGFFSSADLKNWTKESEFGETVGAHGGVWECPDLFPVAYNNDTVWVLFVSINPGGPNGGSATQYFTGEFDGKKFTPYQTDIRWVDYGPDNYAGVMWSNVGERNLFLGWMSNWQYGQQVPTHPWRSAMTVPRDIGTRKVGDRYMLTSTPAKELDILSEKTITKNDFQAAYININELLGDSAGPGRLKLSIPALESFVINLHNKTNNEKLMVGYDSATNRYYIDRSQSGIIDFEKGFGAKHYAPRIAHGDSLDIEVIIDNASVEVFADGGLTVMTGIFFPTKPYTIIYIGSTDKFKVTSLSFTKMKSIWK